MRSPGVQFDIVFTADFRVGDTGAERAIAAVKALVSAGYRVGVLPWIGAAKADPIRFADGYDDLISQGARRVSIAAQGSCRLLMAYDIRLFRHGAAEVVNVSADQRIVICPRGDPQTPQAMRAAVSNAEEALGGDVTLAPGASSVRQLFLSLMPEGRYTDADWPPVLELAEAARAPGERVTIPVLGYYRSAESRAWPETEETARMVLPDHPLVGLAVLGASEDWSVALRERAAPVVFHDPQSCDLAGFLQAVDALGVDGCVTDDPWPEEVLQAIAHGTIPIIRPEFIGNFQSAALYCEPGDIPDAVIDVFSSKEFADDIRDAGRELVAERLDKKHFLARVFGLIGKPGAAAPVAAMVLNPECTVMSLSTNGIGMGHLARQMAIARRLEPNITPVFLGFSQSIAEVRKFGWVSEYLPYHQGPALNTIYWNEWLFKALDAACRFYRPRVLMLDANVPFIALNMLRDKRPGLPMVWVRRAMWGPGRDFDALDRADWFDAVIEPGEVAGRYDTGPTSIERENARLVDPVTMLDNDELLSRENAASELGVSADTLNILLMPGALNNFDAVSFWSAIATELGKWQQVCVVAAEWAITETSMEWPAFVERRRGFPYARWFNAFDFAVSAAGYNSFHELTRHGLPTVFVPNDNPLMDRQDLRAIYAERNGLGLHIDARDEYSIPEVLGRMRNEQTRARMRARMALMPNGNGAEQVGRIISELARSGRTFVPRYEASDADEPADETEELEASGYT
jgi:Glycosyltransferase family 28 C-terminal domain